MLSSTGPTLVAFIMESLQQLDPTLLAFWEGFPCPPPWKEELLFRLNWTGCVGVEVGERMRSFMADKCNIRHDGKRILPDLPDGSQDGGGTGGRGGDGLMVEEDCGLACQIVISVICVLFFALLCIVVIFCVRKHRSKTSSPSHQSSLTAHQEGTKYYTSCHYACAPVMARQLQASLNGDHPETSVLPAGVTGANGHYQPGTYPQHGTCLQQGDYEHHHHHHNLIPHHPHLHHHRQQHPQSHHQHHTPLRLINTPYGQVPAHTSSLIVPSHQFGGMPGAPSGHHPYSLRRLDAGIGTYNSSTSGGSNSDPVYESIGGDSDSARHTSLSEEGACCEYCDCGGVIGAGGGGIDTGTIPVSSHYDPYRNMQHQQQQQQQHRPVFFNSPNHPQKQQQQQPQKTPAGERDARGLKDGDYDQACEISPLNPPEDPPTPCPPMAGYYGDACPQTLPLRPLRKRPPSAHGDDNIREDGDDDDDDDKAMMALAASRSSRRDDHEDDDDDNAIVPLSVAGGPVFPHEDPGASLMGRDCVGGGGSGQAMRRRATPSTATTVPSSNNNNNTGNTGVGGSGRRAIPSLHPNYFLAPSTDQNS